METQNLSDQGRMERRLPRVCAVGFPACLSGSGRERVLYPAQQGFTDSAPGAADVISDGGKLLLPGGQACKSLQALEKAF